MIINGLEVYVRHVKTGRPYHEYDNRELGLHHRFIETLPGDEFAIVVKVHADFEWHGATALHVIWYLDGETKGQSFCPSKRVATHGPIDIAVIANTYYTVNDRTMRAGLAFGDYAYDDDESMSPEEVKKAQHTHGRIRVQIRRLASTLKNEKPLVFSQHLSSQATAPIKLVKKHHISQFIKSVNATQASKKETTGVSPTPLAGVFYDVGEVCFVYRSRFALRKLGVLPPSPIITATDTVDLTGLDDSDSDDERPEIPQIDLTSETTRIKRELSVEDEDIEGELARMDERRRQLKARLRRQKSGADSHSHSTRG